MTTDVNRALAKLKRRTERAVAVVRLLALLVFALVFWSLGVLESRHAAAVPLDGFTMITLAGLVKRSRGVDCRQRVRTRWQGTPRRSQGW